MKRAPARKPSPKPAVKPKAPAPDFTKLIADAKKLAETDSRLMILQALTQTPHRDLEPFIPLFRYVHDQDPLFFAHLAVWYIAHGTVRDLKQLFVAFLSTSTFSEDFREAGVTLLLAFAPFEVERVLGLVKGHENDEGKWVPGISKTVPRCVRTGIEQYLRAREKNEGTFDNVALVARRSLKTLYASNKIKPSAYAQALLFDNNPPTTSRLYALKQLARTSDPSQQARLILENKIPYRVAVSNLHSLTGPVLVALIDSMSPQELINNLKSLEQKGALQNEDIKSMVDQKIKAAEKDKKVSGLKVREAIKHVNLDEDTVKALEQVQDKQMKAKGRITKRTAILIDKSGSMAPAIALGRELCALIAPICTNDLYVWAFDGMAYPIQPNQAYMKDTTMSDWERAFKGLHAAGYTCCGSALQAMQKRNQAVDQVIIVTDQQENKPPTFLQAFNAYKEELHLDPNVIIINVAGGEGLGFNILKGLEGQGTTVDSWTFTGTDYYSLPSIIPMLAGGSRLELLQEVMDIKLPSRKKELAGTKA